MKKQAGSSHNWNTLFLGASAVAELMSDQYNVEKRDVLLGKIIYHSSEIRGLCLIKWPNETIQNLSYFWKTKTCVGFF